MSFGSIIRSGVKVADKLTKPSLQATVMFAKYIGQSGGTRLYASPIALKALVDGKSRTIRGASGELVVVSSTLTFLDVKALAAATGGGPISEHDQITLPDGTQQPIISSGGFDDPTTGNGFTTEVLLG